MKIILKESGSVPVTLHVPAFIAVRFICPAVKAANFGRGMRAAVKELKKAKRHGDISLSLKLKARTATA